MSNTHISYRFYSNYNGGDDTLYEVEVSDGKFPLKYFTSFVSVEEPMKQAEAWRKLYEEGRINEED